MALLLGMQHRRKVPLLSGGLLDREVHGALGDTALIALLGLESNVVRVACQGGDEAVNRTEVA